MSATSAPEFVHRRRRGAELFLLLLALAVGIGAYAASKAGLIQLARVAAKEVAARRIRVNVMAPGGVETAIWESEDFKTRIAAIGRDAAFAEIAARGTPLGRFAKPEEIAGQIAFLLSNEASGYVTGSVLVSDGGYLL